MISNYLKIAWRNLLKNKVFSAINIVGLAIGLACFTLIALYVIDEISYDRHFERASDVYRVNSDIRFAGTEMKLAVSSDPMGPTLKKDFPEVETFTRIYASSGSKLIKKGSEFITEERLFHADSTFFQVFPLPLVVGNANTALIEPNTVVISETGARKYFGTTEVMGKIIEADKTNYKITAVMKDVPRNTHFNVDLIFSMKNVDYQWNNFLSHNFQTYIKLRPGTAPKSFDKHFETITEKYIIPQAHQFMQINSMDEFRKAGNELKYSLMRLTDIHLYSTRFPELATNGDIQYVYIFSAVALFILLLACVNFMNLSTARSSNRSKEVGIRKVLGTSRKALIWQFLTESVLMVGIALAIAIVITVLILPLFNDIAAKELTNADIFSVKLLPILLSLPVLVGLLAGSYPAFFLSGFRPISVLKGGSNSHFRKSNIRNVLVVFQFATSIILIVGTMVVFQQLSYIQHKKLGFNKEQVLLVSGVNALNENSDAFRNEILKIPGVTSGTVSSYLPVSFSSRNDNTYATESVMTTANAFNMQTWQIDYDYLNTLGMEVIDGRNFSRDFGSDSSAMLINESTAKLMGTGSPVGKKIYSKNINNDGSSATVAYTVIGVVRNFNYESLRQNIAPLCFKLGKGGWLAAFRINNQDIPGLVKQVESKWKAMSKSLPFSYRFLDESFDAMYRTEQRMGKIALVFALLAIFIACLGLFGLATYMAEQRIKEIGIRKVLGASVSNITTMLSRDFLKLVLVAALIAFPLAWFVMNKWLEDFAYRIQIGWWIFLAAGVLAVLIALVTVSFQAIKAATANPVKSLRSE